MSKPFSLEFEPRDPGRIDPVLEDIARYWKKYPDMRLAQLIMNVGTISPGWRGKYLYHIEEDELIELMERLYGDHDE